MSRCNRTQRQKPSLLIPVPQLRHMIRAKYLLVNQKHYAWTVVYDWSVNVEGECDTPAICLKPCSQPQEDSNLHGRSKVDLNVAGIPLDQAQIENMVIPLVQVQEMLKGDLKPLWLTAELVHRSLKRVTPDDLGKNWALTLAHAANNVLGDSRLSVEELGEAIWSASQSVVELSGNSGAKESWMRAHFQRQGITQKEAEMLVQFNKSTPESHIAFGSHLFESSSDLQDAFANTLNPDQATICTSQECGGCFMKVVGYCRSNTSISIHEVVMSLLEANGISIAEVDSAG